MYLTRTAGIETDFFSSHNIISFQCILPALRELKHQFARFYGKIIVNVSYPHCGN
mgnify:CR=1 FL=1